MYSANRVTKLSCLHAAIAMLCLLAVEASAQENFVINSSFEELDSTQRWAKHWHKLNTVDFFHAKNVHKYSRTQFWPEEYIKTPKDGIGYVGLWTVNEIIIGKCKPLKENRRYRIEAWVCTKKGEVPTSDFWVSVNRKIRLLKHHEPYFNLTPKLRNHPTNFIDNTDNWKCISAEFIAQGGEANIAISSMSKAPNYANGITPKKGSYVFVDAISIKEIPNPEFELSAAKPLRLKNIYFNSGKAILLPQSYPELNRLYKKLKETKNVRIEISGHTDNTGSTTYNKKLSENRAKAVRDYLIQKGIKENILTYTGYGSEQPISDNTTANGRRENRRVELRVIE